MFTYCLFFTFLELVFLNESILLNVKKKTHHSPGCLHRSCDSSQFTHNLDNKYDLERVFILFSCFTSETIVNSLSAHKQATLSAVPKCILSKHKLCAESAGALLAKRSACTQHDTFDWTCNHSAKCGALCLLAGSTAAINTWFRSHVAFEIYFLLHLCRNVQKVQ